MPAKICTLCNREVETIGGKFLPHIKDPSDERSRNCPGSGAATDNAEPADVVTSSGESSRDPHFPFNSRKQ